MTVLSSPRTRGCKKSKRKNEKQREIAKRERPMGIRLAENNIGLQCSLLQFF